MASDIVLELDDIQAGYGKAALVLRGLSIQVRRGEVSLPEEDDQAAKYELADDLLTQAGLDWYEVSNWARAGH